MFGFSLLPKMGKRMIVSCAACKLQRKKCSEECILAPHFPQSNPEKFTVVRKVFGTNYVIKLLRRLETKQRADAVNSLVYEARARVKDPIHGSVGVIHELQKQISELESHLDTKQEELRDMHSKFHMFVFPMYTRSPDAQDVFYNTDPAEDIMYDTLDPLL